jgi:hypothetical protein
MAQLLCPCALRDSRRRDPGHRGQELSLIELPSVISSVPIADDVTAGILAPEQTIGRRDPAHRDQGHQLSCLPVADDLAVGPLAPGEAVGRRGETGGGAA